MAEIVYYAACSLDGYIATEDGGVAWLNPYNSSEFGYEQFYASLDALVMGSYTYEISLAHGEWPSPDKSSWVFTKRDLRVADPSITLTQDRPSEVMSEIESRGHERVWLMGGGKLASSFRELGLISEYQIWMIPIILGGGITLFAGGGGVDDLRLVETKSFSNGVVMLRYREAAES